MQVTMKTWNWAQKTILVEVLTLVELSQKIGIQMIQEIVVPR